MRDGGDVAIVGAGVIGLSLAFELAERGASVRVYDRAEPGRAASWAAAGMLAPETEGVADAAFLALCRRSLQAYPDFVARVRAAGGVNPQLRLDGVVDVAFDDTALARIQTRAETLRARAVEHRCWDRTAVLREEPWIGPEARGAMLVCGEGQIDNRRFGRALAAAAAGRGVGILRVAEIGLECDARRVLGVRTERGFAPAATVVNACGAWAAELAGVPAECVPPVAPVKGQMLALAVPDGLVRHATWLPGAYVVPRDDGRVLVGATVERVGFDERVTAAGLRGLLDAALLAAPALGGFAVTESWAGLRPGTPDGLPFLGATPLAGYVLATGHYRNGVLLAPITAQLLADTIEGRAADALQPFGLARLEGGQADGLAGARTSPA